MATEITLNGEISIVNGALRGSGAQDNANYFAITGVGFGTKTHQAPSIYDDFSSGTDGQYLPAYNAAYVIKEVNGGYISSLNPRYSGMKSAANDSGANGTGNSEFNTSRRAYPSTNKVFLSYYLRVTANVANEYAVMKYSRITAITQGGAYNGVGAHKVGGVISNGSVAGCEIIYDPSPSGTQLLGYAAIPANEWVQVQQEIKLNTAGVADGIFNTYITTAAGAVSADSFSTLQQRQTAETWQLDTTMLGLMMANVKRMRTIESENIIPNTIYTATLQSVDYSVNSGANPTLLSILTALAAVVNGAGKYAIIKSNTEIYIAENGDAGVAQATYDTRFTERVVRTQISDVFLSVDDFARVVACDSAVYASRTVAPEPVPYVAWADDRILLKRNWNSVIVGTKHLHLIKDDLNTVYLGVYA